MRPTIRHLGHIVGAGAFALALSLMTAGSTAVAEKNPYTMVDNSWVTISGTVESVRTDNFTLNYGEGMIIVEMDDGDRDADAYKLMAGDKVTVSGAIDDDFYETTTIEASSVYVENLGTTFFASAVDEETSDGWAVAVTVPVEVSETIVYGTVTDVDQHEFTVDYGVRTLRVDVAEMSYNPLDDEGYQKVRVGDRVKVSGHIDSDFFEGRELMAEAVVKLNMS